MKRIIAGVLLLCVGIACSERALPQRSLIARAASIEGSNPFWFLGASRRGATTFRAVKEPLSDDDFAADEDDVGGNFVQQDMFSVVQSDDDEDDSSLSDSIHINGFEHNDDNDDNDDNDNTELAGNVVGIISLNREGNAVFSNQKDYELEEKEINNDEDDDDDDDDDDNNNNDDDEKEEEEETGPTTIFLPRRALENIPSGSILALVDDSESLGRAYRRVYRRRRKGPKRRRRGNNQHRRRRRRRGNQRRRRPVIRVIRPGGGGNRVINNRRRRPNVIRL